MASTTLLGSGGGTNSNTNASTTTTQHHVHPEMVGSGGMKKALANSLSLLLIHCEDFNSETAV
jgi:hypothetical protein